MKILFRTQKLRKQCNFLDKARRTFGDSCGRLLLQRLNEIRFSDTLAVLMTLPGAHCHALTGNRKGQYSVDLAQPYRLVFEPAEGSSAKREDGSVDLTRVTAVRILDVEDTHDPKTKRRARR